MACAAVALVSSTPAAARGASTTAGRRAAGRAADPAAAWAADPAAALDSDAAVGRAVAAEPAWSVAEWPAGAAAGRGAAAGGGGGGGGAGGGGVGGGGGIGGRGGGTGLERQQAPVHSQGGGEEQGHGDSREPERRAAAGGGQDPAGRALEAGQHDVAQAGHRHHEQDDRDDGEQPGGDVGAPELSRQGLQLREQGAREGPDQAGAVQDDERQLHEQYGHDHQDPDGEGYPGRSLELAELGIGRLAGDQAAQHGPDAAEQVGQADQVGQDEVPVEPERRQQLLDDLQVDQHHRAGQRRVPRGQVGRGQREHEDRVEVDAAQVGADPAAPAQPVGVGDVGEERGPDQVQAHADHAGTRAAVPAGGGVAALVEQHGGHGQAEDQEQQQRVEQDVPGRGADPAAAEQPGVRGDQGGQHQGHHDRAEQRAEQAGQELDAPLGDDGPAQLQGQQAGVFLRRPDRGGRIGHGQQAERRKLVGQQE